MTDIPPDFGGFMAYWDKGNRAVLIRIGQGKPRDVMTFTPLNLLQARKTLDDLIIEGKQTGAITEGHLRQSGMLPTSRGLDSIMDRSEVDEIAGED